MFLMINIVASFGRKHSAALVLGYLEIFTLLFGVNLRQREKCTAVSLGQSRIEGYKEKPKWMSGNIHLPPL